jgi:gliding motility-associated-like protein
MRSIYKNLGLLTCLSMVAFPALHSQITTNGALTPTQLVNNVLLGGGITASNITYTGYANSISEFTVGAPIANFGMAGGVYLTTGSYLANDPLGFGGGADGPMGPATNFQSVSTGGFGGLSGDPDLDLLVQNLTANPLMNTNDAAVLEFDFVPQSDTVKFRYRFASEEYNDFVPVGGAGGIADVFAFYLTGVTTPLAQTNIALLPGTSTPVSIYTVNNGSSFYPTPSSGPCDNCAFYVDNTNGGVDVVYDGLTTVLTAVYPVICGETYHIKIAIADASDNAFDSGVFLEAGSFTSAGGVNISSNVNWSTNDTILYEGCTGADITFVRFGDVSQADTMTYTLTGTATTGADYTGLNGNLIYGANQDTITIAVTALADGIAEGMETITITVNNVTSCGALQSSTYTLYINDPPVLTVDAGPDQTLDCTTLINGALLTAVGNGGIPPLAYLWQGGPATAANTVNTPGFHYVTVTDFCGQTATDSVNITVIGANPIAVVASNDTTVCQGSLVNITSQAIGGNGGVVYNWSDGSQQQNFSIIPTNTITYTVTVNDVCGETASESVTITVDPVDASYIHGFTAVDGEVNFVNTSIPPGAVYYWDFGDGTTSTASDPQHTYTVAGTYNAMLIVTNPNGCVDTTIHQIVIYADSYIYIPNTFTPGNADGLNDVFEVYGQGFSNAVLRVFNRWGQELYVDSDNDLAWNGAKADKSLYPQGVYAYRVDYVDGQGKDRVIYGHVNLIR